MSFYRTFLTRLSNHLSINSKPQMGCSPVAIRKSKKVGCVLLQPAYATEGNQCYIRCSSIQASEEYQGGLIISFLYLFYEEIFSLKRPKHYSSVIKLYQYNVGHSCCKSNCFQTMQLNPQRTKLCRSQSKYLQCRVSLPNIQGSQLPPLTPFHLVRLLVFYL